MLSDPDSRRLYDQFGAEGMKRRAGSGAGAGNASRAWEEFKPYKARIARQALLNGAERAAGMAAQQAWQRSRRGSGHWQPRGTAHTPSCARWTSFATHVQRENKRTRARDASRASYGSIDSSDLDSDLDGSPGLEASAAPPGG